MTPALRVHDALAPHPVPLVPAPLRAAWRGAWLVLVTLLGALGCALGSVLSRDAGARWRNGQRWTRRWARLATRAVGLRVRVWGPAPPAGALLCPNHVSYLDVLALAEGVGCLFVSKADVARWPLCGALLRIGGHTTVERASRRALPAAGAEVAARLRADGRVAVFLEGTSSSGEQVLPFHAGLVQPALDASAPLVPVALRYRPLDPRVCVGRDVAYWGDHVLVPHLLRLLGLPSLQVEVVCGEPLRPAPGADRKAVAWELERRVRELVAP